MPVKKVLKKAMFQISERDFLPWGIAIHYMKSIVCLFCFKGLVS